MIATTHLAIGATAGLWSARLASALVAHKPPYVQLAVQAGAAFFAGMLSHLALDAIPHNDGIYKTVHGTAPVLAVELAVTFSIIAALVFLRELNSIIIFMGLVGAAWLDALSMLGFAVPLHSYFHASHEPRLAWSSIGQLVIAAIALLFLF